MPQYEYECGRGHTTTHYARVADRKPSMKCACGSLAVRVISMPALHTIGTFARSIDDADVQRSMHADGSYVDPNLCDPRTGEGIRITSQAHRTRVMKDLNVFEKPPSDKAREVQRDKARRAVHFTP